MSWENIKSIYKTREKITKDFFESRNMTRAEIIGLSEDANVSGAYVYNQMKSTDKNSDKFWLTDKGEEDLKNYYIERVGEENIKNAQGYDPNLISVDQFGKINDVNLHDSFLKVFVKTLAIDLVAYFIFGLFAAYFYGSIIGWIAVAMAWLVPIGATIGYFVEYSSDEKLAKESTIISQEKFKNISRIKFAPILSFLILVLMNVFSFFALITSLVK